MARLAESYPMPQPDFGSVSPGWYEKQEKIMKQLEKESAKATEKDPVGFLMSFPVADGCAVYRVVKAKPLTVQHVDYMDGWQIPAAHIRGLTMVDVFQQMGWNIHLKSVKGGKFNA